jgi:SAM-dependent methyltransferase
MSTKWPKVLPPLTQEQRWISDDFMKHWNGVLARRLGFVDRFNQGYCVKHAPAEFTRTLEIGAGLGEHLEYERLTPEQEQGYYALELRANMAAEIRRRFPRIQTLVGDCQQRLAFPDGYFDRVLAIHVLEHLPDLPAAVAEAYRLCNRQRGVFSVVIPCEGSLAYGLARRVSAQRIFEKRYHMSYKWFIEREHINRPHEVLEVLGDYFTVRHRRFYPLPVSLLFCNLCIGLTLQPRPTAAAGRSAA